MPYTVYSLSDPTSGEVRYIGLTSQPLRLRLFKHEWFTRRSSAPVHLWIARLAAAGLRAVIAAVSEHADKAAAYLAEGQAIRDAVAKSPNILNCHRRMPKKVRVPKPRKIKVKKPPTTMTLQEMSALGNAKRWANTTPEQRKAATAKASKARKKLAKLRRLEAEKAGA